MWLVTREYCFIDSFKGTTLNANDIETCTVSGALINYLIAKLESYKFIRNVKRLSTKKTYVF